jgi:hypothetical protein
MTPQVSAQDTDPGADVVPLRLYSKALDEIFLLRRAMAYEAGVAEAHADFKTFPKTRRPFVAAQVERLRAAARGDVRKSYADKPSLTLRWALLNAGASETMTRTEWERQAFGGSDA